MQRKVQHVCAYVGVHVRARVRVHVRVRLRVRVRVRVRLLYARFSTPVQRGEQHVRVCRCACAYAVCEQRGVQNVRTCVCVHACLLCVCVRCEQYCFVKNEMGPLPASAVKLSKFLDRA
jgi:hypothetical protein